MAFGNEEISLITDLFSQGTLTGLMTLLQTDSYQSVAISHEP